MRSYRLSLILLLLLLWAGTLAAQSTFAYSYVPKHVFGTQVFPVTIVGEDVTEGFLPTFKFDPNNPVRPLEATPVTETNGGNTFFTFYFKAGEKEIQLPDMNIIDESGELTVLTGKLLPVRTLNAAEEEHFCGLIATSCKIVTSQVSEFDAQNNLVSLTIKATEANPEEIHTPGSIESGIEKMTRKKAEVLFEYFFVIPSSQKSITSSYYNTLQNRFISKSISTDYKHKPVAAQENLNPLDSSFNKIKKYGLALLALFFFWMFWMRKEILFLVLFALSMIILLTLFVPHDKVCVQEGAPLYILPTETSTTGGQIDREYTTSILNTRRDYYKIEYDHNIIGWIKDEDTCKN